MEDWKGIGGKGYPLQSQHTDKGDLKFVILGVSGFILS